jgi:lysophospholipase L1-like esterase
MFSELLSWPGRHALRAGHLVGALMLTACRGEIGSFGGITSTAREAAPCAGEASDGGCSNGGKPSTGGGVPGSGADSGKPPVDSGLPPRDASALPQESGNPYGEDASAGIPDAAAVAADSGIPANAAKRDLGVVISVGDSITAGFNGGYQARAASRIRDAGFALNGDIINDGRSGWQAIKCTVDGVYQIIEPDFAKWKPDTVLLMIGTNDVGGANAPGTTLASIGHPEVNCSYEQTIQRVNILVEKIHEERPTAMVFLANIIPIMRMSSTQQESAKYAPKVAALVKQRIAGGDKLIAAVDVWTGFPTSTGLRDDLVHPNEIGQAYIGMRFAEAVIKWLKGE